MHAYVCWCICVCLCVTVRLCRCANKAPGTIERKGSGDNMGREEKRREAREERGNMEDQSDGGNNKQGREEKNAQTTLETQ